MLAWRAFSRSSSVISRNGVALTRCQPPQLGTRARFHTSPTFLGRHLWSRRDGTPRSKLKGLVFVTAMCGGLYGVYNMMLVIQELDTANYLLSCLVNIQRVDYEFESVDFNNSDNALAYFRSLCGSFGDVPQQMIDDFFDDVAHLDGKEPVRIVRVVCRDVHDILFQSKGRELLETASEVVTVLDDAMLQLIDMVEDTHADEDEKVFRNQRIKDQMVKDPARSSDYELVG